jgi:hypothetical protein
MMSRLAFLLIVGGALALGACTDPTTGPEFQLGYERPVNRPDHQVPPVPGDTVRISDESEAYR